MKTNVLIALWNILTFSKTEIGKIDGHLNLNRANSQGDSLEYFVMDAFSGEGFKYDRKDEKLECYRKYFSYTGNANNPPDFIIEGGPSVEVKKLQKRNLSSIPLNSSYPKDYLYVTDTKITKECKSCEDHLGGWTKKENIYVVGNLNHNRIHTLWMIYGDCISASKETYERVGKIIKNSIDEISEIEFSPTKELGRVNNVDPLGITYLRMRGMWHIEHPNKVYYKYVGPQKNDKYTKIYILMKRNTYESLTPKPDFRDFISEGKISINEIEIANPNNPMKLIPAIFVKAVIS